MALTQHRPLAAFAGRRYGAFAGKLIAGSHPVGILTQHRLTAGLTGRRFTYFGKDDAEHPVGVLTQARAYGVPSARRFGSFAAKEIGAYVTVNYTDDADALSSTSVLLGVLGSDVPALGDDGPALLYEEVVANALQANYVRAEILSVTAGYTLVFYGDSSFSVVAPAPTGVCEITYNWYIDGVLQAGTGTATIDFPAFAVLSMLDGDDTFAGTSTSVYLERSVSLAVTDAADVLSASFTSPATLRNASLVASDAADLLSAAAVIPLLERTVVGFAVDQADQLSAVALRVNECLVSMVVTDAADTLTSDAFWLDPVVVSLSLSDGTDVMAAGMNTAPGTREKIDITSTIIMQLTLQSPIDLG